MLAVSPDEPWTSPTPATCREFLLTIVGFAERPWTQVDSPTRRRTGPDQVNCVTQTRRIRDGASPSRDVPRFPSSMESVTAASISALPHLCACCNVFLLGLQLISGSMYIAVGVAMYELRVVPSKARRSGERIRILHALSPAAFAHQRETRRTGPQAIHCMVDLAAPPTPIYSTFCVYFSIQPRMCSILAIR